MAEQMKAPLLYPCANRVKMPHVGADETRFKDQRTSAPLLQPIYSTIPSKGLPSGVSKSYVKHISKGFNFAEDVVKDRSFHTLPYSDKYFLDALDVSELIPPQPKQKIIVGRHDARGPNRRHMPCHITAPGSKNNRLRPLQVPAKPGDEDNASSFFLTETNLSTTRSSKSDNISTSRSNKSDKSSSQSVKHTPKGGYQWDEYLLSLVSRNTAEWIVKQRTSPGPTQRKLETFVEGQYGRIEEAEPELVRDNISEIDFGTSEDETKGHWKRGDESMLDKVRELTLAKQLPTDPYADDNNAAFYRLPAGVRRAKKHLDKEEAGAINTTAYAIDVVPYTAPPPPTLRDHMNPRVGDKILDTNNRFVQERLTGAKQVFTGPEDKHKIVLDTDNKYRKVYVEECPKDPDMWYACSKATPRAPGDNTKLQRGLHRWKSLPEPIDDTAEKFHVQPPGGEGVTDGEVNAATRMSFSKSNSLLIRIVDDWRQKWNLDMRYADASPDDLIRDMADIHPHIRLKAITTCARAAEYRPPPQLGIQLDSDVSSKDHVQLLPEQLFIALELCLDDASERVRRAAAIALYTLERPTDRAEQTLREALIDKDATDRYTAAQCLAYYGECDSDVVGELITQLMGTEDVVRHEQASALLARLSENSTLVHSMIGEQLNSSSWRHRIMACRVLPKLQGHINKDLVNKLIHLMWTDWHAEVRKTAAQTLGKTGHGRRVHDELRDKIHSGNERARTEAVSRIGQLGIMTAKLLPAFLQCFSDNYVSVREEVCIACGNLGIEDDAVLKHLVDAVTYDPIWKVKALAIQALGRIGRVTQPVQDCVLWSFRYEDKPGVRVEACHTIVALGLREPEVAQILQDRYLVEKSDLVKTEIIKALEMFAISPSEDLDMVTQIKAEVRRLCTRDNICTQIALREEDEEKDANLQRMIYNPPDSSKKEPDTPRYRSVNRKLARVTSNDDIPHPSGSPPPSSRPYSQETSTADREIMAILDRYDDEGMSQYTDPDMLIVESDTTENKSTSKESRLVRSPTDLTSQPKSRVTFASPEADYQRDDAIESQERSQVDEPLNEKDMQSENDAEQLDEEKTVGSVSEAYESPATSSAKASDTFEKENVVIDDECLPEVQPSEDVQVGDDTAENSSGKEQAGLESHETDTEEQLSAEQLTDNIGNEKPVLGEQRVTSQQQVQGSDDVVNDTDFKEGTSQEANRSKTPSGSQDVPKDVDGKDSLTGGDSCNDNVVDENETTFIDSPTNIGSVVEQKQDVS